MNLLSGVPWHTVALEETALFERETLPGMAVMATAAARGVISPGALDTLHQGSAEDYELLGMVENSELLLNVDDEHWRAADQRAEPRTGQDGTWLEAHYLGGERRLLIPGDGLPVNTVSLWTRSSDFGRRRVVSFLVDAVGHLSGALFHRKKQCQENPDDPRSCIGVPGGCSCVPSLSYEGRVVVQICCCRD
ncbi:MAG TPA: hypothetical protein VD813_06435 [Pseudonocardia sp.]|nr:hypothetical protein [Pseudonocardia sp.]